MNNQKNDFPARKQVKEKLKKLKPNVLQSYETFRILYLFLGIFSKS